MIENTTKPPIYSKWAILGFCMFFSPIFGGVLLRQNLVDIGKKGEAIFVLPISVIMAIFAAIIASMPFGGFGVTAVVNFIQGALLVEVYFRKHFQDEEEYPKKRISKPFAISMLIVLVLTILLILTGGALPNKV
jgi:hypothetical protein